MKKILLISYFLVIFFFSGHVVFAEAVLHIHLFYNTSQKTLVFDKTFSPTISLDKTKDIFITEFDEKYSPQGQYELGFLDSDGIAIDQVQFTPPVGSFVIDAPDFGITKTITIRDLGNPSFVLKQDVGQYVSCNNNSICEYEKGETDIGCIQDCANGHTKYSTQTTQLLNQGNGKITDPVSGNTVLRKRAPVRGTEPEVVTPPPPIDTNEPTTTENPNWQSNHVKPTPTEQTETNTNTNNNEEPAPETNQTLLIAMVVFGVVFVAVILFLLFRRLKNAQQ